jgi:hypothetical protein
MLHPPPAALTLKRAKRGKGKGRSIAVYRHRLTTTVAFRRRVLYLVDLVDNLSLSAVLPSKKCAAPAIWDRRREK